MPKQLNEFAPDQPELGNAAGAEPANATLDGGHDHEGAMAKADLYKLANYSMKLFKQIDDQQQLEAWVQAKITKAADYIASVFHYLEYEMKFTEYGNKLENSDVYNESEKLELKNKLQEAREMLRVIKLQQAEKLDEGKASKKADKDYDGDGKVESGKDEYLGSKIAAAKKAGKMEESMGGGYEACEHCGGTGHVEAPTKSWSPEAKAKAAAYNKKAKAYHAASKRIDANQNGIPDSEEAGEQKAPESKKKPVAKKEEESTEESQDSSKHSYGQGIYENEEVKGAKKPKHHAKELKVRDDDMDESAKPDFLDMDKDGNKKESFKKAVKDKKVKEGKDEGKPGKNFAKIAKDAGKRYGSKEAGERVAGAVKAKLAKQGKLEEGVIGDIGQSVSNFAGDMFNTDASLERRSPQLQALIAMRKKFPDGSPEAKQLDARIQAQKDRVATDGGEVMGQGGMPKPVVDPATFSKQNPNFKESSLNESAELDRMKQFLGRLLG